MSFRSVCGAIGDGLHTHFLASKAPRAVMRFRAWRRCHHHLFDFQRRASSTTSGAAVAVLDTGPGKTACELEWARQCAEKSNGRALLPDSRFCGRSPN